MIRRVVIVLTLVALALSMAALTGCHKKGKIPPPMTGGPGSGGLGGDSNRLVGDMSMAGTEPVSPEFMPVVYFDYDSPNIRADQVAGLERSADFLKKSASVRVRVEGNCDERGTNEYNMGLGAKRAEAIAAFLATRGVARERLTTLSNGEERPVEMGHSEAAYAKNRRGEFFYTAK